jgi:hypothetical protein
VYFDVDRPTFLAITMKVQGGAISWIKSTANGRCGVVMGVAGE